MEDLNANYDVRLFWGEKIIYCHENCEHFYVMKTANIFMSVIWRMLIVNISIKIYHMIYRIILNLAVSA